MRTGDTIIANATAPGLGARAMVRMSGPSAINTVERLRVGGERCSARGVRAARLRIGGEATLPCLVATFLGPRSYTGEDVVEIALVGNPTLVERLIAGAIGAADGDLRMAGPGEFTARAYLNERLTLEQAEGVAVLIASQTDAELEEAGRLLSGKRGEIYRGLSDRGLTLLALVEAGIDFTDQEDVVAIAAPELVKRVGALVSEIESMLEGSAEDEVSGALPRVALVGVPNAGKSTLFNALLGRRRAVVSDEAGTTRDVLEEALDLSRDLPGGGTVLLCDTPGVNEVPRDAIDAAAQSASREFAGRADVVVWCDPSGRFEGADSSPTHARRVIRVRTKADLPHGRSEEGVLEVSALDGFHLPPLRRAIADGAWAGAGRTSLMPRHRRALRAARGELRAAAAVAMGQQRAIREPEVVAGHLRAAVDSLGELTGRMTPDDVIGRVFATFCVGK